MRNAKEVEQKLIELRGGNNNYSYEEIAGLLGRSVGYVREKCASLLKKGLIAPAKKGPKPKKTIIKHVENNQRKPKHLGCCCQYPSCNFEATFTFSLVPLCTSHYEVIKEESDLYYSVDDGGRMPQRKHWSKISKRSAELWVSQKGSTYTQTKTKHLKRNM